MKGLFVEGEYVKSSIVKPSKKSDYKELRIAIDIGNLQNLILVARPDYKVPEKVGETIRVAVGVNCKIWNSESKRFVGVPYSFYVKVD